MVMRQFSLRRAILYGDIQFGNTVRLDGDETIKSTDGHTISYGVIQFGNTLRCLDGDETIKYRRSIL